jgi:hypothetical protein
VGWLPLLLAALLMACATTPPSQLAQGQSAYDAGQYELAISTLDAMAADGDAAAAYWTGRSYEELALAGDPGRLNEASEWYAVAVRNGRKDDSSHKDASFRLGRLLYFSGNERELGLNLLQHAAVCGHVEAGRLLREQGLPAGHQRCEPYRPKGLLVPQGGTQLGITAKRNL